MRFSSARAACSTPLSHVRDRSFWILLIALLALTAVRIAAASAYPLVDDETYYWVWSRHLAWGYPDHPPAVAAMVRVTTALVGDSPLGVRLGPILMAFITSLLVYDLARQMFDRRAGLLAAAGYQIIPIAAVGAIIAAPDAPFILFWVLAVWCLWRARTSGRAWAWYGAGLAGGLCLMSKLSALFLGASLAGFLLFVPSERRWLRRPEPYRAAAIALTVVFPLVAWNSRHDAITYDKLLNPAHWIDLHGPVREAAAFAGASAIYYGPITWVLLLAALAASISLARRGDDRFALLAWLAAPLIGFTALTSFNGIPKPHWPAPAYLMLLPAAAALWPMVRQRRGWRRAAIAGVALNVIVVIVLYALPFIPSSPAAQSLRGWEQASSIVAQMIEQRGNPEWFVLTRSYQDASQLSFYLHERYLITPAGGDNEIVMRLRPRSMLDRNAIFITDDQPGPGLPLHLMFWKLEQGPDIEVQTGAGVRRFQIYFGYGFRGLPRVKISPI